MKGLVFVSVISVMLLCFSALADAQRVEKEEPSVSVSLRAGLSNVTGIVGVEMQYNHTLAGIGWLPGSPLRIPFSLRYLVKPEAKHSPIFGLAFVTNNATLLTEFDIDFDDDLDINIQTKNYHLISLSFSYRFVFHVGKEQGKVDVTVGGGYGIHLLDDAAKGLLKRGHPAVDLSLGLHF